MSVALDYKIWWQFKCQKWQEFCLGKSCWIARIAIEQLYPILRINLLPNFIFQCYRPQTWHFYLFFPALSISGIHKVLGIKFKGGYVTWPLAANGLLRMCLYFIRPIESEPHDRSWELRNNGSKCGKKTLVYVLALQVFTYKCLWAKENWNLSWYKKFSFDWLWW